MGWWGSWLAESLPFASDVDPAILGNVAAVLLTVVYVKVVIGTCDALVRRKWIAGDVSRKIVHMAAGAWIIFWPLFDDAHWTWRLNILVPGVFSVQLFVKGALIRNPDDPDVRSMTRTGDPWELCEGPLLFTLVMNYMGLFLFRAERAVISMAALGFGDGLAPIVGSRWGRHRFKTLGRVKTLEGSAAVFLATIVGCGFFHTFLGMPQLALGRLACLALVATVAEALSPSELDNLAIPIATLGVYRLVAPV